RNLLLTTGDAPPMGNSPDATAVFDVDSVGLTRIVGNLNKGLDIGGNFLGNQTGFLTAVVADPSGMRGAENFEREFERLRAKLRVGAECVVTRPVFDEEDLDRFLVAMRPLGVPVILTILPLTGFRNAEYLANELHMSLPAVILERMRAASSG